MKNLTPYKSHALNESSEYTKMGFVLSITMGSRDMAFSYTIAGIYDTFYDFAIAVTQDISGAVYDEDDGDETVYKNVIELMDDIVEVNEANEVEWNFWHGFTLKPGADGYHSAENTNAYSVTTMLEKLFTNPKEIMTPSSKNSYADNMYLANSIKRDPSKLELYSKENKEEYEKLVSMIGWDQKKLDAVLKVNRIKNQF
jgi:hypothetical protein